LKEEVGYLFADNTPAKLILNKRFVQELLFALSNLEDRPLKGFILKLLKLPVGSGVRGA
jgi:hypothetical protein